MIIPGAAGHVAEAARETRRPATLVDADHRALINAAYRPLIDAAYQPH
ncbi:hypothetical protein [Actinoplanes subglobosus]|uniref:Uncharacterized protein n=1 Tax=Actinoplanes subglobosus TaxID=1547892 RepID=A0ABV8J2V3_9ACTN